MYRFLVAATLAVTFLGCQRKVDVDACASCLPQGVDLGTLFGEKTKPGESGERKVVTVRAVLERLGAYCKDGTIYDRNGKRVVFHKMFEYHRLPNMKAEVVAEYEELWRQNQAQAADLERENMVVRMWHTEMPR